MKGVTYLVTRRCTRRYFLFRPDADRTMEKAFWYCLAVVANKYGIVVHSVMLMSDHLHLVLTDVRGILPDFFEELHRILALVTKAHRGWPEEVFNKSQTSAVALLTPDVIVAKMAYVVANATLAGLVRFAEEWPGAMSRVRDIGARVVRAERPALWFDAESESVDWPDVVELPIVMPKAVLAVHGSIEAAQGAIADVVKELEREASAEAKKRGRPFMGAERAVKVKITERGSSWELFGARNPTFAAGGDPEVAHEAVERLHAFRTAYREALAKWCAGDRDVVFPAGTWWMRVHHRARCVPRPEPPG